LGYTTSLEFAQKGAHVFLACRSAERAQAAIEKIQKEVPDAKVEFLELDLGDLKQVKKAGEDFVKRGLPLHIL
jgi:NAD(P)-dependent dehydrogenase (short-subunit alcohol dehydrogenase family)